jgi:threonine synthase
MDRMLWMPSGKAMDMLVQYQTRVMIAFSTLLEKEEGLSVLPASAASVAAMAEYVKDRATSKDKCFRICSY